MSELRQSNPALENTTKIATADAEERPMRQVSHGVSSIRLYRQAGFATVVEPLGDSEFGCLPEPGMYDLMNILLDTIDDPSSDDVVVDLSQLCAISARMTNMLSAVAGRFKARGRRVALCSANAAHRPLLAAVGLQCFPSLGQAISHLLFGG
jgi:hypothetical protein